MLNPSREPYFIDGSHPSQLGSFTTGGASDYGNARRDPYCARCRCTAEWSLLHSGRPPMMALSLGFGVSLLIAGSIALAQTTGTATGTLTIDGKNYKLSHAHASTTKDPFRGGKMIRLVLSDLPVDDGTMEDESGVDDLVQVGKLNAIEFSFTTDGTLAGGRLVHGMKSVAFTGGSANFTKKAFDTKSVSGKVWTNPPLPREEMKYTAEATFTAPVQPEAKPTAEGAAAATTAPGLVAVKYMKAARARDVATLKQIVTPDAVQLMNGPGAKEYVDGVVKWMAPGLDVVRVYEWPTFAKVDFAKPGNKDLTTMTLVKTDGAWKVK